MWGQQQQTTYFVVREEGREWRGKTEDADGRVRDG